jgi:hypothetical protein
MKPSEFNRQLDNELSSSGEVTPELFAQFTDAYTYDAASTVGWVQAKLSVLQARLKSGAALSLYEPSSGTATVTTSQSEFSQWVARHFPVAMPKN